MNARASLIAVALAAAAAAAPAFAQPPISVVHRPSVEVSFADLNIGTSRGMAALNARIHSAANQLCQPDIAGILREQMERRACYREAIASAQQQVSLAMANRSGERFAARPFVTVAAR